MSAGVIAAVRDREPGDEVEVVVVRDGKEKTFTVVLAERRASRRLPDLSVEPRSGRSDGQFGLTTLVAGGQARR